MSVPGPVLWSIGKHDSRVASQTRLNLGRGDVSAKGQKLESWMPPTLCPNERSGHINREGGKACG